MFEPRNLESDHLQSDNYEPESSPGAGDGKGWRLSKNGDFQIGTATCLNGEIFSPHDNVRVDSLQYDLGFDPDKQRYLDEKHLREAGITPAGQHLQGHVLEPVVYLTQEQIDAAKCDLPPHIVYKPGASRAHQVMVTQCDLEVVVRIDLPEGVDPVNAEGYAHKIRQIVMDTIDSSEALQGMRSGRITAEATVRAETDSALASRIGGLAGVGMGLDVDGQVRYFGEKTRDPIIGTATGKEYLCVKQPGGPVAIGDLQKCCGRDTFTEQFLNREVRSDLKPEVAYALSMAAPMTANGKVPINNLPRPVDDDQ